MPARRAEAPAAVGREELPADQQWARAIAAVVLGIFLACSALRPVAKVPNLRTLAPELRALSGVPSLVIRTFTGEF